jgi:hypothetical protein
MAQRATKFSAAQLHDIDMGSLNCLVKALEAVQTTGIHRKVPAHGTAVSLCLALVVPITAGIGLTQITALQHCKHNFRATTMR